MTLTPMVGAALLAGWLVGMGLNRLARHLTPRSAQWHAPGRGRELALQAATALCAGLLWLRGGPVLYLVWSATCMALLLLIAAIDFDCRLVLNRLLLFGAPLGVARVALDGLNAAPGLLLGGAVGLALFLGLALLQRGGLGMGDVKLAGLLGLWTGYPLVLTALAAGVLLGGVCAGLLLATRLVDRRAAIPYAPFLSAGGILALLLVGSAT